MSEPNDKHSDGDYQYRAVFVLGGGWRARPWKDRIGAIQDIGVAAEKGAPATAIERKDTETGKIERAPTPEDEWLAEEDTDLKIRVEDEEQGELVPDGGEVQQTAVSRGDWVRYDHPPSATQIEAQVVGQTEFGYQLDNGAVIEESELEVQDLEQ